MEAYLDNNATTKLLPAVVAAMQPYTEDLYANPSSPHAFGQKCRQAIETARASVACLLGASNPSEIVFTSSATESIGHAFHLGWEAFGAKGLHIVTSAVEHTAVLEAAEFCRSKGAALSVLRVNSAGQLDLDELDWVLSDGPAFVSLMLANNETGVIFPIDEASAICSRHKAMLHIDAAQATGKVPLDFRALNCDYLTVSAHKFHGPKGIGALTIRQGAPRVAWLRGHQESETRGGTENVAGIVGFGAAAESAAANLHHEGIGRMSGLRDLLEKEILALVPGSQVNGDIQHRVCNTSNIYFPKRNSADLVEILSADRVYVSAGSACTTGGKPSHVLRAMYIEDDRADSSLRFSVSRLTTDAEIRYAIASITRAVALSPDSFSAG